MFRFILSLVLLATSAASCSKDDDGPEAPDSPEIHTGSLYYSSANALIRYDFDNREETIIFDGGDHYSIAVGKGKFAWYKNDFYERTTRVQIHDLNAPDGFEALEVQAILESTPEFAVNEDLLGALARSSDAPDTRTDLLLFDYQGGIIGRIPHVKDFAFCPNGKDLLISAEALNEKGEALGYALALIKNYRGADQESYTIAEFAGYSQLPTDIAVSPGSTHAVYTHSDHLYTTTLEEAAVPLQVTQSRFRELDACWSPDGEYLLFTANAEGDFTTDCGELRIVPARPGSPVTVPENAWDNAPADPMQPVNGDDKVIHSCGSESIIWVQ